MGPRKAMVGCNLLMTIERAVTVERKKSPAWSKNSCDSSGKSRIQFYNGCSSGSGDTVAIAEVNIIR